MIQFYYKIWGLGTRYICSGSSPAVFHTKKKASSPHPYSNLNSWRLVWNLIEFSFIQFDCIFMLEMGALCSYMTKRTKEISLLLIFFFFSDVWCKQANEGVNELTRRKIFNWQKTPLRKSGAFESTSNHFSCLQFCCHPRLPLDIVFIVHMFI